MGWLFWSLFRSFILYLSLTHSATIDSRRNVPHMCLYNHIYVHIVHIRTKCSQKRGVYLSAEEQGMLRIYSPISNHTYIYNNSIYMYTLFISNSLVRTTHMSHLGHAIMKMRVMAKHFR